MTIDYKKSERITASRYIDYFLKIKFPRLPRRFVYAIAWAESDFSHSTNWRGDKLMESKKKARGIFQIMPIHFRKKKADPDDLETNIRLALSILDQNRRTFKGNLFLTAAGYNFGPGNILKWRRGKLARKFPGETVHFAGRVMEILADPTFPDFLTK